MVFPLCWHLTQSISKTVISSWGGCYLHCANEEIESQGQNLRAGNWWSQVCCFLLHLYVLSYVWSHSLQSVQCCTFFRSGGRGSIISIRAANIFFDILIKIFKWVIGLPAPGSVSKQNKTKKLPKLYTPPPPAPSPPPLELWTVVQFLAIKYLIMHSLSQKNFFQGKQSC